MQWQTGDLAELQSCLREWRDDLDTLRQNTLLSESTFISFAKKRGVPVAGLFEGDPSRFLSLGWLRPDGSDHDGAPLFHPFRLYPMQQILRLCAPNITPSSWLRPERVPAFVEKVAAQLPSADFIGERAEGLNRIVDLAILLEPLYWPRIVGATRFSLILGEEKFQETQSAYREKATALLKTLSPEVWLKAHQSMCSDASWLDANQQLYVLLRVSSWAARKEVVGEIGGALWIRHAAEVIRRGFEDAHGARWQEEDQGFGTWAQGARQWVFGAERPFDDVLRAKPYLAYEFGLFTGSAVRWYVEGETEYYAILELEPDLARYGIDLFNLRGVIKADRDNIALKLRDWLAADRAQRRFSIISFDTDAAPNSPNLKTVRRLVQDDQVVGHVAAHNPDFELANFTLEELAEVAARIDEAAGFDGHPVRSATWQGVTCSREFEEKYRRLSARKAGKLKGEDWGRALARYANEHPIRADDGRDRTLWSEIRCAIHAHVSNYDAQVQRFMIDPSTFETVPRHRDGPGRISPSDSPT